MGIEISQGIYYRIFDKRDTSITNRYKSLPDLGSSVKAMKNVIFVDDVLVLNQVHGKMVVDADFLEQFIPEPQGDASVTSKKSIALAIKTADCVPVLFFCPSSKIIGAAHCGWRSAKSDIIKELCAKMKDKGAKEIKAIIGPSIQQKSYEVDAEYYQGFIADSVKNKVFFTKSSREGRYQFDLPSFVVHKLLEDGVQIAHHIKNDTYSNPEIYPSYRRSSHTGEEYKQNILSVIWLW